MKLGVLLVLALAMTAGIVVTAAPEAEAVPACWPVSEVNGGCPGTECHVHPDGWIHCN